MSATITQRKASELVDGDTVIWADGYCETVQHVRRHLTRDDLVYVTMLTLGGAEIVYEYAPDDNLEVLTR